MRTALPLSLCLLAVAAPAGAAVVPAPEPILGSWRVTRTGTVTAPRVYGTIRVTGGPDSFVGTTTERTFLMGDGACALAAGKQVWQLRRAGFDSGRSTRIRYTGTSIQPYGDSSISCPEKAFEAWWVIDLTDGSMSLSMPLWNRTHGLDRVDTTPPRAQAQHGTVTPGRASSLNFAASEESGWTRFEIRALRGSTVLLSRGYDHVFASSTGETQTLMWTPPRSITGPLRLCLTGTDGSGIRSSESCATLSVRSGGATSGRPRVSAYPVTAAPGQKVRLRWRMGDDSGLLRLTITVHRPGGRTIAMKVYRGVSARLPGEPHFILWNPPSNPADHYTFCISVRDADGNRARGCATITLDRGRAVAAPASTLLCGHVDVPGGRAWRILATLHPGAERRADVPQGQRPARVARRVQPGPRPHDAALGAPGRVVPARRRRMHPRPLIPVVTAVALLPAPLAHGATVQLRPGGLVDEEPVNVVTVIGDPGEASALAITVRRAGRDRQGEPTRVVVRDAANPLRAGPGCRSITTRWVQCTAPDELGMLRVRLGDGDDRASVDSVTRDQFSYDTLVDGGEGNDVLVAGDGGELRGGPGDDDLTGSSAYEEIQSGPGDDVLRGEAHGDFLAGGAGDDLVLGGPGNDDVIGGTGDDTDLAPAGTDHLVGGSGDDTLDDGDADSQPRAIGADRLDGGPGDDGVDSYLRRSAWVRIDLTGAGPSGETGEGDTLTGIERAFGGTGGDVLLGTAAANWLDGRDGMDVILAGDGHDRVFADGADAADAGAGNDELRTDAGSTGDLRCGTGSDVVRVDVDILAPSDPRGPLVERACEVVSSGTGVRVDPRGTFDGSRILFGVTTRRHGLRLALGWPSSPFATFSSAAIAGSSVSVRVPPAIAGAISSGGLVLRASVGPFGNGAFVWRFLATSTTQEQPP